MPSLKLKKQISLMVENDLYKQLELLAAQRHVSMAALCKGWVVDGMRELEKSIQVGKLKD